MLFPEATDETKRAKILSSPVFKPALDILEENRRRYLREPIQALPLHLFNLYFTEGDRRRYEHLYFDHRGRLNCFAVSVLLYNRPEDIEALEDIIWEICNEYTWVLPAHTSDLGDRYDTEVIDLFSAETGSALAEIYYLLKDVLSPKIVRRILDSLEERIFNMYLTHHYSWETVEMNWAAVCGGSVGMAFIYAAPDRFPLVEARLVRTMDCFLKGFGTDGICVEGIGYWTYGFGYFTYFAQLYKEFTNGREDLFERPICRDTAAFQQTAYLRKNYTISFADGYQTCKFAPGLTAHMHKLFGTRLLPTEYASFDDNCHRFASYLRNFFWFDPDEPISTETAVGETYYPSSQWYICNRKRLSLTAKSGHNNEPHNHNDIGNFALVSDKGQILCDFGCGEYTRDYFLPDKRYTYLCNSSFGHSVPIINGNGQLPGIEFRGEVKTHSNGTFALDIAEAYRDDRLIAAVRELKLDEDCFSLKDSFEFKVSGNTVCERFVTMLKPEVTDSGVVLGDFTLTYDSRFTPAISDAQFLDHYSQEVTLYFIDFDLGDATEFSLTVK